MLLKDNCVLMPGRDSYGIRAILHATLNGGGQTSTDADGGANLKRERKSLSIGESHISGLSIGESHIDKTRERFWDT